MNSNVPPGAAIILNFIGSIEAPEGYDTIYGNNQDNLPKPLTEMTLDEILAAQAGWSKRFGSSAAGRYQFMRATLKGLMGEKGVPGTAKLKPDLQDMLAFHLLVRRGYDKWVAGSITDIQFGKLLAQEWASFPVLERTAGAHRGVDRGETYYAGDKLNKALVKPERIEALLAEARAVATTPKPAIPAPPDAPLPPIEAYEEPTAPLPEKPAPTGWVILLALIIIGGAFGLAKLNGWIS